MEGYACRYKLLRDGRRSITGFLVPGDMCDLRMFIHQPTDDSVGTVTSAKVAEVPWGTFLDLIDSFPRLCHALRWNSLVSVAIQREWAVSLGQRNVTERMAHLLCEFFVRLQSVGLTNDHSFEMPMNQVELADMLGLSPVHTNRVLQEIRAQGLITGKGKTFVVPNLNALQFAGLFDPGYLHLGCEGQAFDADGG